jgi:hypothetical protein
MAKMQRILLLALLLGMTGCYVATPIHGRYYAPRRVVVVHDHHYYRH